MQGRTEQLTAGGRDPFATLLNRFDLLFNKPLLAFILCGRSGWQQDLLEFLTNVGDTALHRNLVDVRIKIESRVGQILLRLQRFEQPFFDGFLRHQFVHGHGVLLPHAMSPRDTLLQHRRIPWQVDVDYCIGTLEV